MTNKNIIQPNLKQENTAPEKLEWTPELVKRFWDGLTHTRLLELGFSRQVGKSLIVMIEHLLPKKGVILDFGAGDGDLIKLLCERGFATSAYENSGERQHKLIQMLSDYEKFTGIVDAASDLKFDVIIMAEVIEHLLDEEIDKTLVRVVNMLVPGGILVITTPNDEDLELNMAYCPISNKIFHRWQHVRSFTAGSLKDLLAKYGVEELATHKVELNDHIFLPGDNMWGQKIQGERPSFLSDIKSNMSVTAGSEQNLIFLGKKTND